MQTVLYRLVLILSFSTFSIHCIAQQIQLIDENTMEPIPGVAILNEAKNRGILTDAFGKADLSFFTENTNFIFRHFSYLEKRLSQQQIQELKYIIPLTENIVHIQEVVVSANRWEQKQEEVPHDIVAITARDIVLQNPQTTADMLQQSGEVFVQKSQQGGGSPMLRGFAANSVLLVVDGVRMNNAIYRSGNLQNVINLDANILEGAEVIFGPGSVIYGSDAMGGVLDFHTKNPLLNIKSGLRLEGSTMARYATANGEKTAHADVSLGSRKLALLTSLSFSSFGDLRSGKRGLLDFPAYFKRSEFVARENGEDVIKQNPEPQLQLGSAYQQLNLLQKFRYAPSDQADYHYSFHYSTSSDVPRYDRLTQRSDSAGRSGELRFAEWYYGPQTWMLHSLQSNFYHRRRLFEQARITAAYQQYKESRHSRRFGREDRGNQLEQVDVFTVNIDFDVPFREQQRLFYGLESAFNWVSSIANAENITSGALETIAPRYGDQGNQTQSISAYSSLQYPLGKGLVMNAGARYTWYRLESNFSEQFYAFPFNAIQLNTSALNGNIGIAYAKNRLRVDFLASSGLRAPNIDDLSKIFDPAPEVVTVPNPGLQPEYSYNLESSLGYESKAVRVRATAYTSLLDNAIVRKPFLFNGQDSILYLGERKRVVALTNTGSGLMAGASLNLRLQPRQDWLLSSTLTYGWGEDRNTGERLRHIPPLFGQASLSYQKEKWSAILQMRFNGKLDWEVLPAEEQGKGNIYAPQGSPAWATLDIKANWKPLPALEISSGLENILDTHYRTYSSGISAAGRNLYLSLRTYF